jgi:hypothetical protein
VAGVGQADMATPRFNYTGDPYYTDGIRVVMMMGEQHVPLEAISTFHGETRGTWCLRRPCISAQGLPCLASWASCYRIPWHGWIEPPTNPGEASRHRWLCEMRVQRLARLVRGTLAFSKKAEKHMGAIRYFIGASNRTRATA